MTTDRVPPAEERVFATALHFLLLLMIPKVSLKNKYLHRYLYMPALHFGAVAPSELNIKLKKGFY